MSSVLSVRGADMYIGEVRTQGIIVSHEGEVVIPVDATYQRFKDGAAIDVVPVAAVIEANKVYADIPAGSAVGSYFALFCFSVNSQLVKVRLYYRVLDAI